MPVNQARERMSISYLKKFFKRFKGHLEFLQVFGERLECVNWFTRNFGKEMGTWIKYSKLGKYGENINYLVNAGPGLCE